ncbi:MAG: substrate-binding domain-containing protein [Bacteroidota bacterium]
MKLFLFVLLVSLSACSSNNDTIKIKGSDTEVNLAVSLAEEFHKHNSILVSVSGGGSGLGLVSLLNGNADIANSSRSIKISELDLFKQKGIEIDSFVFAQDAIAFVTSVNMPIDSISVENIAKILKGELVNWSSLTDKNMPITIYGRQSNSGTYDYVKNILGIHFSPYAKQMNGNAQIIEAIKADASGFGYVSAGYVLKGNATSLKILTIYDEKSKAISPLDSKAIASSKYYFQRPLFQYYKKRDFQKIKPFLAFEKSVMGAKIIYESGYYSVNK